MLGVWDDMLDTQLLSPAYTQAHRLYTINLLSAFIKQVCLLLGWVFLKGGGVNIQEHVMRGKNLICYECKEHSK